MIQWFMRRVIAANILCLLCESHYCAVDTATMKRKIQVTTDDTISKDETTIDTPKMCESTEHCAAKAEPPPQQRIKIMLMGDSITQLSFSATLSGWGTYLADVYQRRADVYNRGFSGYNTDWFAKYLEMDQGRRDLFFKAPLDDDITEHASESSSANVQLEVQKGGNNVKLVIIFFGANDASDAILNPRHHVPLTRFQSNLHTIASLCRKNYGLGVHILFITPPPVHHESRLKHQIEKFGKEKATGKLERSLELSGMYASAVESVANQLGVPCLNLWEKMQESKPSLNTSSGDVIEEGQLPWGSYLSDGLHLSREGNLFVGRCVQEMIHDNFPDIAVSPCPSFGGYNSGSRGGNDVEGAGGVGPWHDQIDSGNPLFFKHERD